MWLAPPRSSPASWQLPCPELEALKRRCPRSPSPPAAPPQVDLTFTAEGTDAHPSTLSLRGLDYGSFYRQNGVGGWLGLARAA